MSEKERDRHRRSESEDPLEAETEPLDRRGPEASDALAEEGSAEFDTTTWSRGQAPPVLFEEEATVVSPPMEDPGFPGLSSDSSRISISESVPKTPIAPSSSLLPILIERVEPSLGRGERLRLDAAHWRVSLGRADHNDVRLYTDSASREHAVIAGNESGEWVLTPVAGKSVEIDGEATFEPVVLEVGMNLVMGGDHLRCVTEGLDRSQMAAQTAADLFQDNSSGWAVRLGGMGSGWWLIGGVALVGLALIAFAWFRG